VIITAGTRDGEIPGAREIWEAKATTGDYHGNMNADNYVKWFDNLLDCLTAMSGSTEEKQKYVITLDNAAYHSVRTTVTGFTWPEDRSLSTAKKAHLIKYLLFHGIEVPIAALKPALHDLVREHLDHNAVKVLEAMARKKGHEVLFLPAYNPKLQPIEEVWGFAKNYVACHREDMSKEEARRLLHEGLDAASKEKVKDRPYNMWTAAFQHVDAEREAWMAEYRGLSEED